MTHDGDLGKLPNRLALILSAVVGAIAVGAVVFAFEGWPQDGRDWAHHIGYALAGSVVTALLGMSHQMLSAFGELGRRYADLAQRLTYQDDAFRMLENCRPQHCQVIRSLLALKIRDEFKVIPHMSPNDYLDVLRTAVNHSERWAGIHRKPLRELEWFVRDIGRAYLEQLGNSKMSKLRIFIVDRGKDAATMQDDLRNLAVLRHYWDLTGTDVKSYWIATDELARALPWVRKGAVPGNCALYDGQLLIGYDEDQCLLTFDLADENEFVPRIVAALEAQLRLKSPGPFEEIPKPRAAQTADTDTDTDTESSP